MTDIFKMLEQFKGMQGRLQQAQDELSRRTFTASVGGGMVAVECDGKLSITKVTIDRSIVNPDDVSSLESLLLIAITDAQRKAAAAMQEELGKVTGGLELPFKLPF